MTGTVVLTLYSKALDEIYELRAALAYEAEVLEAHLALKSFPRSRRDIAEDQVSRMRAAARGNQWPYSVPQIRQSRSQMLRRAGAEETLTRAAWEAETTDERRPR